MLKMQSQTTAKRKLFCSMETPQKNSFSSDLTYWLGQKMGTFEESLKINLYGTKFKVMIV